MILFIIPAVSAVYSQSIAITDDKLNGNSILNNPYRYIVSTPVLPDSADVRLHEHKAFWRAGAETVGFNIGLWAFDRYVQKGDYAYISWKQYFGYFFSGSEEPSV